MSKMNAQAKALIETAKSWRVENNKMFGCVLIWDNKVYGWKNTLRDPQHEQPGAITVDACDGIYEAQGGNEYDGAERWEVYETPE